MKTEIEAKWLDIAAPGVRVRLRELGAALVYPERLMRRYAFDYPQGTMRNRGGWARVRDEGDRVTMSYKQLNDRGLHGTHETTLVVDSFEHAKEFLEDLGLVVKSYQETKRELWRLADAEITIDTWPWIPTFVEIEAPEESTLWEVAAKLELPKEAALHGSVEIVYQRYYDVTEEDVDSWSEITFTPVPGWLEQKRKNS